MVLGCFGVLIYTVDFNVFLVLVVSFLSSALIYFSIFSIMPGGFKSLQEYFTYGRLLFERKG
jgi:hypothetical protein